MPSHLPKLSYVLLSHNREKYIRAAVESAFAQDYAGELEYIFSDDCSTDSTFDIIKECVAAYKGDRHVVVTQTPQNGHLAMNTNHAVKHVTSDWVIRADDDDISTIDRCSLIAEAIGRYPDSSYIAVEIENFDDSEEQDILTRSMQPTPRQSVDFEKFDIADNFSLVKEMGSRCPQLNVWRKDAYDVFGPLDPQAYYVDDYCIFLRANLLGCGVLIKNTTLHFIRMASNNMCRGGDDGSRGYGAIMRLERFNDTYYNITLDPLKKDLALYRDYVSAQDEGSKKEHQESYLLYVEELLRERELKAAYWRKGIFYRYKMKRLFHHAGLFSWLRLLPMPLFAFLLASYRRVK